MKRSKPALLGTLCFSVLVLLTSFTLVKKNPPAPSASKVQAVTAAINSAKADGKITYSELKNIATVAKGEKPTLKDKIAWKIFGKKIENKLETTTNDGDGGGKSQLVALLLCIFVGDLGIH